MKKTLWIFAIALCALGVFFVLQQNNRVEFPQTGSAQETKVSQTPQTSTSTPQEIHPGQLENPPHVIRALYLTSWSGGSTKKINYVIDLAKRTPVNAVVIDIKDYSGYVGYETDVSEVRTYGAEEKRIRDIDAVVQRLHDAGIYVIGRVTVFQDPILAHARPEWAVQDASSPIDHPKPWEDRKGISWMDAASKDVWNYNVAIAQDAVAHGFDEINFDYVRFPSDGDLDAMRFPVWNGQTPKHEITRAFFQYLHEHITKVPISADLFGLTTTASDDLGIGQVIEDAYQYFDFVSPMVYPSHYASGSYGYTKPALHPYEIIFASLSGAMKRLYPPAPTASSTATSTPAQQERPVFIAKLRPWIQDFDLGADYTADMIQAQIRATRDATKEDYVGYMIWAPSNVYTEGGIIE